MPSVDVPPTGHAPAPSSDAYDAVVVGGGASGLSAAVFLARYGLDVVVFDRGPSAIRRCALVENYLGFLGVTPAEFLALGRGHVRVAGGDVVDDLVTDVTPLETGSDDSDGDDSDGDARFRVRVQDGDPVMTRYVVGASVYDGDYLAGLPGLEFERGDHPVPTTDHVGRTAVDGAYVAGWLSGGPHQVLAAAGHGVRVAKAVLADHRVAVEGFWRDAATHWDWRVDAEYGDEAWREEVEAWLASTRPGDGSVSEERFADVLDAVVAERLDFRRSERERDRRRERSRALLRAVLFDDESSLDDDEPDSDDEAVRDGAGGAEA